MTTKDFIRSANNIFEQNEISNMQINELKKDGWKNFSDFGMPPNKHTEELWKYTNFSKLQNLNFSKPSKSTFDLSNNLNDLINLSSNNIYIVNGFYDSEKSNFSKNIIIENEKNINKLDYLVSHMGTIAKNEENEMLALNSSLMSDPVFISLKNNSTEISTNIFIISTDDKITFSSTPRLFIEASENSNYVINEIHINLSSEKNQTLEIPVLEYLLQKNSEINHKRIQLSSESSYFFNFDRVQQNENSKFNSVSFSTSGELSRFDIHTDLIGENSECSFHGLYITDKNQHQENEISTTHSVGRCSSDQMFKGILAGKSRAVFSGKVLVKQDAQKTQAFQKDLNFLLSEEAEVDTKPSLEIYADDVECSHGATAGNMDKSMLFYLQSRGINKDEAMSMLIKGFAQEIIDEFDDINIISILESILENKINILDIQGVM